MSTPILAAGAVLVRHDEHGQHEIAVIHRPHRSDWTLPKGKVDPGEVFPQTAVREVAEETGLRITLGLPLTSQHYTVGDAPKTVHYWRAAGIEGDFIPNAEVDSLKWLSPDAARELLTYDHDRLLVDEAIAAPHTTPLLLIRHAHAGDREAWLAAGNDDLQRPLTERGQRTANSVTAIAAAFGVRHVVTSPALRCTQTVAGLAEFATWQENDFVRDGADIDTDGFADVLSELTTMALPVALCTHGEQVDWLIEHFGREPFRFTKGGVLVLHRRCDDLRTIVTSEWYPAPR